MATQNQNKAIQTRQPSPLTAMKSYLSNDSIKKRFEEMLGKRAGAYMNSIINLVHAEEKLLKCTPESIVSSAMIPASLNLSIDKSLGQAAIVPYGTTAQFQIMYKGVTQLCIRSGQYQTIHCTEVYKDEIENYNPITSEIKFTPQSTWKMRYDERAKNVAGHYAYFKLLSGFEKCDYMTLEEAIAHAKKYSKAYQYDLRDKKKTSKWSTDPVPMGNKTVLLRLLSKYGIMSIEMQEAYVTDHNVDFAEIQEIASETIKNQAGSEIITTQFEDDKQGTPPNPECQEPAPDDLPPDFDQQIENMTTGNTPTEQEQAEKQSKVDEQKAKLKESEGTKKPEFLYTCANGHGFDVPKISGKGANQKPICPKCLSDKIEATEDMK